jgi:hypothetical protein
MDRMNSAVWGHLLKLMENTTLAEPFSGDVPERNRETPARRGYYPIAAPAGYLHQVEASNLRVIGNLAAGVGCTDGPSAGLRLPSAVSSSLTLVSPLRKKVGRCLPGAVNCDRQRAPDKFRNGDSSLIRRHPEIFFVSFEHLAQQLQNPLFQREGRRAAFNRRLLRVDLQLRGGSRIRSHKQASLLSTGKCPQLCFLHNPQKLIEIGSQDRRCGSRESPTVPGTIWSGYRIRPS